MGRKRKGRGSQGAEAEDFVPAVFARTSEEADEYRELLNDHDIPAIIHEDDEEKPPRPGRSPPPLGKGVSRGVPVLVPEALLDEASEVIADRDSHDLQPGEDIEDEDEEEDELGPAPLEEGPESDEEEGPRPKPKSKSRPQSGDHPFGEEEEDTFDIEEDDEEGIPAGELGLEEGVELEEDQEEDEGEEPGEFGPAAE